MTDANAVKSSSTAAKSATTDYAGLPQTRANWINEFMPMLNTMIANLKAADHGDPTLTNVPPPPPA